MKKYLPLTIVCLAAIFMLLAGCGSSGGGSSDNIGDPQISNLKAKAHQNDFYEILSFPVGSTVYFEFTEYDEDLDINKIYAEVKKDGTVPIEYEYSVSQPSVECNMIFHRDFNVPGTYIVKIKVKDKDGNESNILSKEIIVRNSSFVPQISGIRATKDPESLYDQTYFSVGDTVYFIFTAYDEDLDVNKIDIEIKKGGVDFDEYEKPIPGQQPAAVASLGIPYTFTEIGNYTVEIEVEDARGNVSNELTKAIVVEAPAQ